MSGDHPASHTTLVRSNDRFISTSISLGDLIHIHPYSSWHHDRLFAIRFRHGSMDMELDALTDFIRQAQEAIVAAHRPESEPA